MNRQPGEMDERSIARVAALPPTAVAHPCRASALRGAVDAAEMGIVEPILVGPRAKIEAVAEEAGLDIARYGIAHALGLERPKVAIMSAMETVDPSVPSTLEAAALCKMADRGQITGAELDGPLALDNAIDPEATRIKAIASPVAGHADILVVPDLEAGNMPAKSLSFMANADSAGIVLGARLPITLTSRADTVQSRLASRAVATLVAAHRRQHPSKAT